MNFIHDRAPKRGNPRSTRGPKYDQNGLQSKALARAVGARSPNPLSLDRLTRGDRGENGVWGKAPC